MFLCVFFFKQKTAYDVRISDWSSDVCSSDLGTIGWLNSVDGFVVVDAQFPDTAPHVISELKKLGTKSFTHLINTHHHGDHTAGNIAFKGIEIGRASCRERVCQYV